MSLGFIGSLKSQKIWNMRLTFPCGNTWLAWSFQRPATLEVACFLVPPRPVVLTYSSLLAPVALSWETIGWDTSV